MKLSHAFLALPIAFSLKPTDKESNIAGWRKICEQKKEVKAIMKRRFGYNQVSYEVTGTSEGIVERNMWYLRSAGCKIKIEKKGHPAKFSSKVYPWSYMIDLKDNAPATSIIKAQQSELEIPNKPVDLPPRTESKVAKPLSPVPSSESIKPLTTPPQGPGESGTGAGDNIVQESVATSDNVGSVEPEVKDLSDTRISAEVSPSDKVGNSDKERMHGN